MTGTVSALKLPVFVRPMARRGFRTQSGQALREWKQTVVDLVHMVQR